AEHSPAPLRPGRRPPHRHHAGGAMARPGRRADLREHPGQPLGEDSRGGPPRGVRPPERDDRPGRADLRGAIEGQSMTGNGQVVSRVLVIEPRASLAALIVESLNASRGIAAEAPSEPGAAATVAAIAAGRYDAVVYSPLDERARDLVPDLGAAGEIV